MCAELTASGHQVAKMGETFPSRCQFGRSAIASARHLLWMPLPFRLPAEVVPSPRCCYAAMRHVDAFRRDSQLVAHVIDSQWKFRIDGSAT